MLGEEAGSGGAGAGRGEERGGGAAWRAAARDSKSVVIRTGERQNVYVEPAFGL